MSDSVQEPEESAGQSLNQGCSAVNQLPPEKSAESLVLHSTNGDSQEAQINSTEKRVVEPTNFTGTGLLEFLKTEQRGKEIFKKYHDNDNYLSSTTRSQLCRLVIERERKWQFKDVPVDGQLDKFTISTKRFSLLAKEIVGIFEHECEEAYYIPFKVQNKKHIPTSGKLWNHYNYDKDRLKKVGVLVSKEANENLNKSVTHNVTTEDQNKLDYLKVSIDDWSKVTVYWDDTYKARRHLLTIDKISTIEYLNSFQCLRVQSGLELIDSDFKKLQPTSTLIEQKDWSEAKSCIILMLNDVKILSPEDIGLRALLNSKELQGDKEDIIIFHLLPYLITSQRPRKRSKSKKAREENDTENDDLRPSKLSMKERRNTFILEVTNANDIETAVSDLQKHLQQNNQTFQPLVVAQGTITNISQYCVIINDQIYITNTCFDALVLALKIFFVYDCQYPENSLTLWIFVQKCLFGINLPTDINNVNLNILLGRISNTKGKSHKNGEV